jgi:hypothetical protein
MVASKSTKVMTFTVNNKVVLYNTVSYWPNPNKIEMIQIGDNSSIAQNGGQIPIITSPGTIPTGGPKLFTRSADGKYLYLSGAYTYNNLGNYTYALADTGFWQDGRVYRIDFQTGVAEVWHTFLPLSAIPDFGDTRYTTVGPVYNGHGTAKLDFAAIHGIAFDNSGHVLICDRVNEEVGIYDTTTFNKVGAIPVKYPHQVAVNSTTGEIYILNRQITAYQTAVVSLYKYSGWQNPTLVASKIGFIPKMTHHSSLIRMVVAEGGAKPVIWLTEATVWAIQDDGSEFTVLKKFSDLCIDETSQRAPQMFERLALDRRNETLYFTDAWSAFYKIMDWDTKKAVYCSTSLKRPLWAGEPCIGPDGYLYVRQDFVGKRGSGFSGKITRYTTDYYHAPAVFPSIGNHVLDTNYYGRYGIAYGDKGLDVSREGKVAVLDMFQWVDYGLHVFNQDGSLQNPSGVIYPITKTADAPDALYNCGGVKYDYDGNIYIGVLMRPGDHTIPSGFASDEAYDEGVGAVVKFPPAGGHFTGGRPDNGNAVGALKVYPQGLGGFSGLGHYCQCRSPRFDLDDFGRLFIPNALTSEVKVTDNSGNTILTFGEYANVDSKGPGSLVPTQDIPLATPLCIAAGDNYLYISDVNNARLVRAKMNFVLDNIPEIKGALVESGVDPDDGPALSAKPNPFNPISTVCMRLPVQGFVQLQVFNVAGKLVKTVASGEFRKGVHRFNWDATDAQGQRVSAGLYLYRFESGSRVLFEKVILAK